MANARETILEKLRRGRRDFSSTPEPYRAPEIKDRLGAFIRGLEKVFATYAIVQSKTEIAPEIEKYLQQQGAGKELVVTGDVNKAGLLDNSSLKLIDAPTR